MHSSGSEIRFKNFSNNPSIVLKGEEIEEMFSCHRLRIAKRYGWRPARSGAWTRQGDVPFDAGGGGAVRRSVHEVAGVSQKRNTLA